MEYTKPWSNGHLAELWAKERDVINVDYKKEIIKKYIYINLNIESLDYYKITESSNPGYELI